MALAPIRPLAAIAARPMTPALISLKLLLSPGLVLLAWWLGRRFGPTIGGRTAALPVVAGPAEGTALGNLLVQARACGALSGDLAALRRVAIASSELVRYTPGRLGSTEAHWDAAERVLAL